LALGVRSELHIKGLMRRVMYSHMSNIPTMKREFDSMQVWQVIAGLLGKTFIAYIALTKGTDWNRIIDFSIRPMFPVKPSPN